MRTLPGCPPACTAGGQRLSASVTPDSRWLLAGTGCRASPVELGCPSGPWAAEDQGALATACGGIQFGIVALELRHLDGPPCLDPLRGLSRCAGPDDDPSDIQGGELRPGGIQRVIHRAFGQPHPGPVEYGLGARLACPVVQGTELADELGSTAAGWRIGLVGIRGLVVLALIPTQRPGCFPDAVAVEALSCLTPAGSDAWPHGVVQ